jgi:hypothetical protein
LEWKAERGKQGVAESTLALAESGYVVLPNPNKKKVLKTTLKRHSNFVQTILQAVSWKNKKKFPLVLRRFSLKSFGRKTLGRQTFWSAVD